MHINLVQFGYSHCVRGCRKCNAVVNAVGCDSLLLSRDSAPPPFFLSPTPFFIFFLLLGELVLRCVCDSVYSTQRHFHSPVLSTILF